MMAPRVSNYSNPTLPTPQAQILTSPVFLKVGPLLNCSLAAGTTLGSVISFLLTYYLQR
jgi:hypothetical protein